VFELGGIETEGGKTSLGGGAQSNLSAGGGGGASPSEEEGSPMVEIEKKHAGRKREIALFFRTQGKLDRRDH